MGSLVSVVAGIPKKFCLRRRRCRVLLLGLDNAGKTTVCHRLLKRYSWPSQPRPGHHVLHTTCSIENVAFDFMDPSGDGSQKSSRETLWVHCLNGSVDAVAVVVDAADYKRLPEARSILKWLFQQEVVRKTGMPVLILGNKADSVRALGASELQKALGLTGLTSAQRRALLDADGPHMDLRRRIASFHPGEAIIPPGQSPVTLGMCSALQGLGIRKSMLWLASFTRKSRQAFWQPKLSSIIGRLRRHTSYWGQVCGALPTLPSFQSRLGISQFGRHARLLPTHVA